VSDITKNTLLAIFSGGVGLASLFLLSKHLGVSDYGTYTAYITAGMWVNLFTFQWLRLIYIRYGTQEAVLSIVSATQLTIVMIFLAVAMLYSEGGLVRYSLFLIPVIAVYELYAAHLRVTGLIDRFLKYQIVRPVFFIAALLIGLTQNYGLDFFYFIVILSYLIPFVLFGGYRIYRTLDLNIKRGGEMLTYGLLASMMSLVSYTFISGTKYSIFLLFGNAALGRISLPLDIAYQGLTAVYLAIHAVSFNKLLNKYNEANSFDFKEISLYRDFLFVLGCAIIFLGVSLSGSLGIVFIDSEFEAGFSSVFSLACIVFTVLYWKICYVDTYYHITGAIKGQIYIAFPLVLMMLLVNYCIYINDLPGTYFLYSLAGSVFSYFILGSLPLNKKGLGFNRKHMALVAFVCGFSLMIKYYFSLLGYWWNISLIAFLPLFVLAALFIVNPMKFKNGLSL